MTTPARAHLLDVIGRIEAATKTVAYYERVLNRAILDFYASEGGDSGVLFDRHAELIEQQFERAWNEGARDMGYGPEDMTDEDREALQERIDAELDHALDFALEVEQGKKDEKPASVYQSRVSMWANRYNDIVNEARTYFGGKQRLVWQVGDTEHCDTCLALDGIVATAEQWGEARERGIYPQSQDLDCHGFHCQCTLSPTNAPLSEGGIPV